MEKLKVRESWTMASTSSSKTLISATRNIRVVIYFGISYISGQRQTFLIVVWLSRMDGHLGLANSLSLKLAEITNHSQDSNGGAIVRCSSGEPTGLLIDSAMKLVFSSVPEVSVEERREALLRAS